MTDVLLCCAAVLPGPRVHSEPQGVYPCATSGVSAATWGGDFQETH